MVLGVHQSPHFRPSPGGQGAAGPCPPRGTPANSLPGSWGQGGSAREALIPATDTLVPSPGGLSGWPDLSWPCLRCGAPAPAKCRVSPRAWLARTQRPAGAGPPSFRHRCARRHLLLTVSGQMGCSELSVCGGRGAIGTPSRGSVGAGEAGTCLGRARLAGGRGWDHRGSQFGVRPVVLVPGWGAQEILVRPPRGRRA